MSSTLLSTSASKKHEPLASGPAFAYRAAEQYRRPILLVLIAMVVILVGSAATMAWRRHKATARNEALAAAFATLHGPIANPEAKSSQNAEPSDKQDDAAQQAHTATDDRLPTFNSEQERQKASFAAFADLADSWGGNRLGTVAAMMAASLASEMGDVAQAARRYEALSTRLSEDDDLYPLVIERLAYAQHAQGDVSGAIATLGYLDGAQRQFGADEGGVLRARFMAALGDTGGAEGLLKRVKERFPRSELQDEMRIQLEALVQPAAAAKSKQLLDVSGDKTATGLPQ